jgi:hypothetical protein
MKTIGFVMGAALLNGRDPQLSMPDLINGVVRSDE